MTTTLESIVETLHYTEYVLVTISKVQNYSSSLEPLQLLQLIIAGPPYTGHASTTVRTLFSCYCTTTVPQVILGVSPAVLVGVCHLVQVYIYIACSIRGCHCIDIAIKAFTVIYMCTFEQPVYAIQVHVRLLCNKLTNIVQHVLGISKASHVTNTVEQTNLASIVFSDLKNWQFTACI